MALVKQHLSSDMRTIKKHSITSNTKLIQNYQTNIGILYHQTELQTYPGKFWELTNRNTKVLNDVSCVSMKSWQSLYTKTITCFKQKIRNNKQLQAQKQIHASQLWQQKEKD